MNLSFEHSTISQQNVTKWNVFKQKPIEVIIKKNMKNYLNSLIPLKILLNTEYILISANFCLRLRDQPHFW